MGTSPVLQVNLAGYGNAAILDIYDAFCAAGAEYDIVITALLR